MSDESNTCKAAKARHDLALELINIGYKALAKKLHPDAGGSEKSMARLKVRDHLLAWVYGGGPNR